MKALVWADMLGQLHELPCALPDLSDDERIAMGCDGRCDHRGGHYLKADYDSCPVSQARRDPQLRTVIRLEQLSSLGMLNGKAAEGDRYVQWVPSLLAEYRNEMASRRAQEVK